MTGQTGKNALLLHGTGSTPDLFWFPWLRDRLTEYGYRVDAPQLPDPETPAQTLWCNYILANYTFDANTLIVGHSAGAATILGLAQRLPTPIARAVLVAGFINPIPGMPADHPMLLDNPDPQQWRDQVREWVFVHSDNDPWGCDHHQGEALRARIGGTLVVLSQHGHFGSRVFNQPYDRFPLLERLCLDPIGMPA